MGRLVYKRHGSPYYWCRFQLCGIRIHQSTKETVLARAEKRAAKLWSDAVQRQRGEEPEPTLAELVDIWREARLQIASDAHLASVERVARLHFGELSTLPISQITQKRVETARNTFLESHGKASANHWLRHLRLLFRWALRHKMISVLPWSLQSLKVQKRPRPFLPPELHLRWLAAIDSWGREEISTACRLMLWLGLREIEAYGSRWDWVDLTSRTYTPGLTKGKEAQPLRISPWLAEYLAPLRKTQGWILPNPQGLPYSRGLVRRAIQAANEMAGVHGITPHRLRGSYGTSLSQESPIQDVQGELRHKDWRTTMNYLERDWTTIDRAHQEIARRMTG